MIRLALLVLCLTCPAWGDEPSTGQHFYPHGQYGGHGTTVCIEIRPAGHHSPTKVCGPVVHGSMQTQLQPQEPPQRQRQNSPPAPVMESEHRSVSNFTSQLHEVEPKEARPPCNRGYNRMPMFMPRTVGDGMIAMGVPLETEGMGWRQAQPPCPHEQAMRAMPMPAPMPAPMLSFQSPFAPAVLPRAWLAPAFRSAEETDPSPKSAESKEDYEHLFKECDEKTKMLKEREKEIADLKGKMVETKKEADKQGNLKPQMVPSQLKN